MEGFDINSYLDAQKVKQSKMALKQEDIFCADSKYIVATSNYGGFNDSKARSKDKCPIFKNYIPYKSCTLMCNESELDEIIYWSEWVMGGGCVSKHKVLKNGYVAIQIDYMCW